MKHLKALQIEATLLVVVFFATKSYAQTAEVFYASKLLKAELRAVNDKLEQTLIPANFLNKVDNFRSASRINLINGEYQSLNNQY